MAANAACVPIDVRQSVVDARREVDRAGGDSSYGELMATYVRLGELLDSGHRGPEYVEDCAELAARMSKLDRWIQHESDQRWAAWVARNTTFGGGCEQ